MNKKFEYGWMSWKEITPFRDQLIEMELDLIITYHYPEWGIPRSYVEERVDALEYHIATGNTVFWGVRDKDKLYGYIWGYTSSFIDKRRWNLRSIYFCNELRGEGFATLGIETSIIKAQEMDCNQISTHYAIFNERMGRFLNKHGFFEKRIEMVRDI